MHAVSRADLAFRAAFESGRVSPAEFSHGAHPRLVYCYLVESDAERAAVRFRSALLRFLRAHGVDASTYGESLTRGWVLAVERFMHRIGPTDSADAFLSEAAR